MKNSTTGKCQSYFRAFCVAALLVLCSTLQSKAQIPTASFAADSTEGCVPLTVHFSNTSLQATSFFWDFGNGNTSTLPNPQTVYLSPGSYTVTLIAHNSVSGKSDTLSMPAYITVVSFPTADFSSNVTSGCSPLTVNFTNNSVDYTSCVWDFGDGFSSTQTNPSHTYSVPGFYTVKLVAYSAFGCSNVKTKLNYIRIYDKPNAQLSVTPSSSCDQNEVFQFSSSSTGITNYSWNFGQPSSGAANTSTLPNPTHVYGAQGTFTVSLIVEDANGCSDTAVVNNLISIGAALTPTFTWNKSAGCEPLTVKFTPPSITGVTSYSWNFGDPASGAANTSTAASPTHTYNSAGTYSVSLFITTSSGCNGGVTLNNIITVDQPPVAAFNANPRTGCSPFTVQFNNASSGATTYLWEFGNGTTSTLASPTATYTTAGTYTVRLHAYSANGCETIEEKLNYITVNDIVAKYNSTPRSGCAPLPVSFNSSGSLGGVSWLWDFGDPASGAANTSTLPNPTHTYTAQGNYYVQLIVTSADGCVDTVRKSAVTVAASSVVYTVPDTIKGCQPYSVSFTNPLLGATFFHWDFGVPWLTNDTSNKANPTFVFDSAGVYTVTLTATMAGNNGSGCTQVFNPIAYVQIFPMIISPITYVQATPCAPYLIHFSDTTQGVIHWDWDFGDGTPHDTTQFPSHTYTQPGTYTVTLNIELASGCMTSLSTVITLGQSNPITVNKDEGCSDDPFTFGLTGGSWSNVSWDFGDGVGTSTSQTPTYVYNVAGNFIVTLNATGSDGCSYTFQDTIVTTNPQPSFVVNGPTSGCDKLIVYFTNTSTGATSYLWDFGDPTSSTGYSTLVNPSRKFSTPKDYTITLTATNGACSRSVTYPALISIYAAKPNFSFTQNSQCFPITIQLTDLTGPAPAVQWGWNFFNGVTDSTQNPTYTYLSPPASDSISLWVRDTNGCTATKKLEGIKYKQAHFTVASSAGCIPATICFTDSSDTTAVSWQWNFGDGSTSTTRNPCHTYTADSSYTVTLITTFSSGCKDTIVVPNAVNISSPHADFNAPTVAFCAPALVNFNNLSTNATSYLWDFGDSTTSVAATPSHVYNIPGDYTVTLIAINGSCRDTMKKVNYLHVPGTSSYFNLTSLQSCVGNLVQFTDSSLNAQFWLWNFGDGDSSTLQNPTHLYSSTGSYIVSLITSDTLGCSSHYIFNNPIVVHPVPTANASTQDTVGCNVFTASFTQNSSNATSYLWNFGDPASGTLNTDTTTAPTHTYATPGLYQVYLVATNSYGCSDTFWLPTNINVKETPVAQFTNTPSSGCTPLTVSFNNTSTSLNNPTYLWNFGNSTTSVDASPQVTYADSGQFAVSLIVTNGAGCSDTATTTITSYLSPTALFSTADTAGCSPYTSNFTNLSTNATSYLWNFGDGSTSTQASPSHTYNTAGSFTVTLITSNASGCKDTFQLPFPVIVKQTPRARFNFTPSSGCTPLTVSFTNTSTNTSNPVYSWNFGNGNTAGTTNASTVYADSGYFNVTLLVTNDNGCFDDTVRTVRANLSPTALAATNDTSGCTPYTVNFTNNSTNAVSYLWNFGNGNTSTQANPTYTYYGAGNFTATLIATNSNGCKDTFTFPYSIHVKQTPSARFNFTPTVGCTPLNVNFASVSSNLSNPTYSWNFGNGNTATTPNASTFYTDSGYYNVTLLVTNDNGCFDDTVRTVRANLSPTALAATNDTSGCTPYTVNFTNNSTNAVAYLWNFGNGNTSTQANPTYTYYGAGNFTATLIATNSNGCQDTFTFPYSIHVKQTPSARFNFTPTVGCTPLNVTFASVSSNLSNPTHSWNFGNGNTATTPNASTVYTDSGYYNVTLLVTNDNGCFDDTVRTVRANLSPTALAATNDTSGCTPYTVNFTNNSTNAVSYLWNFGDGSTSTDSVPAHTYKVAGNYTATLVATNSNGCKDTFIVPSTVNVNQTPTASFTKSKTSGCAPLTVNFTNTSSNATGASAFWDFGNGQTSTSSNTSTTYTTAGNYTVWLTVTSPQGCVDSISQTITVYDLPTASAATTDTLGCTPHTVQFSNNSLNATSYLWNFGNGATSTAATPSYTYTTGGNYTVTLIATNSNGCKDTFVFPYVIQALQSPLASFSPSSISGCTPLTVNFTNTSTNTNGASYNWIFGNGSSSPIENPSTIYTDSGYYAVQLQVMNSNRCMNDTIINIQVNLSPTAIASTTDTVGCNPMTAVFTNNSINATAYSWNFGDGITSSTVSPSHIYTTPGNYTVTLIAASGAGCLDTLIFPYTIQVNQTPVASFTKSVSSGCTPLTVHLNNTSAKTNGASYLWDFGNGSTSTDASPDVTYNTAGTYTIQLQVTNASGCTDTTSQTVQVNATPVAIASTADTTGCTPYLSTFANNSTNATGYLWNFGDGATSSAATPSHTYNTAGNYTVTLIAFNAAGCSDTLVLPQTITVHQTPVASFIQSATTGCAPLSVNFNNTSLQEVNATYNWNFDNGSTSTLSNPSAQFVNSGSYNVTLIVTNTGGCSDTATHSVNVLSTPVANGFTNDTIGCTPFTVTFTSTSTSSDSVVWYFGNGQTASGAVTQYTYTQPGIYQPYLVTINSTGCTDTFYLPKTVRVNLSPVANFSASQTAGCAGTTFDFSNLSSDTISPVYQWTVGGFSTASPSVSIPLVSPGFYTVSLTVTNSNGCSDTEIKNNFIQVYDTLPPPQDPIYSVSVLSDTQVEIKWQNSSALDLGAYKLWRLDNASGNYVNVYTDNNPTNASMNPESSYIENGLNTLSNTYTYKLQTLDRCSMALPLNVLKAHTTINVSAHKVGTSINVNWTPYGGCPVSTYEITRTEVANGSTAVIASVPGTQLSYLDTMMLCPGDYSYRIKAYDLCGLLYTSLSDTAAARPDYSLQDQQAIIVRSTVVNNQYVLTEWSEPQVHPERVKEYNIYRSTDTTGTFYSFIATVSANVTSYDDYDVNVNEQNYYYKVEVVSDCDMAGKLSSNSSSILLKAKWENESSRLRWTKYDKWDTGVERYEIEKYNWSTGQWEKVKTVPGNATETNVDE